MIQSMSLPICSDTLGEYRNWADLQQEVHTLGCDGIEAIWGGETHP